MTASTARAVYSVSTDRTRLAATGGMAGQHQALRVMSFRHRGSTVSVVGSGLNCAEQ
ncbi:hypothetical protein BJ987_005662 [Nocardia goodfellowii]|uniref:Uncharacterized protein n=1 Tax=Nocardia goodfellowii TaxID=882446 RepID=A0ABS4QQ37_9NOCA|nr:hypothetical protein [Nocardia goodfellowii]